MSYYVLVLLRSGGVTIRLHIWLSVSATVQRCGQQTQTHDANKHSRWPGDDANGLAGWLQRIVFRVDNAHDREATTENNDNAKPMRRCHDLPQHIPLNTLLF